MKPSPGKAQAIGSSVCGVSHVRDGLPNQDALGIWDQEPGYTIVAVADGHGGERHFRSAQGSQLAVEAAITSLRRYAAEWEAADPGRQNRIAATDLPEAIVSTWLESVQQHLADGESIVAYGTTLIAALITTRQVLLLQIGDGDALLVGADGKVRRPIPSDNRLVAEFTTSLCREGASGDFRFSIAARAGLLLLATDGYSNSFRTEADFLQVGTDLAQMIRQEGLSEVKNQLPQILEHASTNGSGDDITVALVSMGVTTHSTARVSELRNELVTLKKQFQRFRTITLAAVVVVMAALAYVFRNDLPKLPPAHPVTDAPAPAPKLIGPKHSGTTPNDHPAKVH